MAEKPQLNMRVSPELYELVEKLRSRYELSQRQLVEMAVTRMARAEGLVEGGPSSEAADHLDRAGRLLGEISDAAEEARGAVESALDRLEPLPKD